MKSIQSLLNSKWLLTFLFLGVILRLGFIFFGAELYFNRPNIFVDSDTGAFQVSIENLLKHGVYSIDPTHKLGYFARMPGYPFFMGLFYFLSGGSWILAYKLIAWSQIFLDIFAIFLIYRIIIHLGYAKKVANWAAFLYASYPFIIIWNPVVYAESISVFLLILGLYFYVINKKWSLFLGAMIWGFGILVRPQLSFLFPAAGIMIIFVEKNFSAILKKGLILLLGLFFSYGLWPVRNFVFHNQVVFTQKVEAMDFFSSDVIAFRKYVYSVKAEWEPQFSQIISGEKVEWPAIAYHNPEDSLLLEEVVQLSRDCGKGFNYWKRTPVENDCNPRIEAIFNQLRLNQKNENPFNFYIKVPFQNMQKTLFKTKLKYQPASSFAKYLSMLLFLYRTFLIFAGLVGVYLIAKTGQKHFLFFIVFGALVYFYVAFIDRNVEMRYLLQADVLLLIPAAYTLNFFIGLFKKNHVN